MLKYIGGCQNQGNILLCFNVIATRIDQLKNSSALVLCNGSIKETRVRCFLIEQLKNDSSALVFV